MNYQEDESIWILVTVIYNLIYIQPSINNTELNKEIVSNKTIRIIENKSSSTRGL